MTCRHGRAEVSGPPLMWSSCSHWLWTIGFMLCLVCLQAETFVFVYIGASVFLQTAAWGKGLTWTFLVRTMTVSLHIHPLLSSGCPAWCVSAHDIVNVTHFDRLAFMCTQSHRYRFIIHVLAYIIVHVKGLRENEPLTSRDDLFGSCVIEPVEWGAPGHRTSCTGSFKAGQHLAVLKVSESAATSRDGCAAVTPDDAVVRNMTIKQHILHHLLRLC